MPFPTITFGNGLVTSPDNITFTKANTISSGGLILYIIPTQNIGPSGLDIGFTYINQFGDTKITAVSTAVAAGTTSGTRIRVVLEPGDTGIREIINISYFRGGTTLDSISFESWNEGLGAPPFSIASTGVFDRNVPGSFLPEQFLYEFPGNALNILSLIPELYYSNPQVNLNLLGSNLTEFLPELQIDRGNVSNEETITKTTGITEWIPDPTQRDFQGFTYPILKSFLESVVGQVVSGYVTNIENQIIRNATSIAITSTGRSEFNQIGDVDPLTGFYQLFIKAVIYDKRFLIIRISTKTITLDGTGTPLNIDGTKSILSPYDLQFACPVINCDFNITRTP